MLVSLFPRLVLNSLFITILAAMILLAALLLKKHIRAQTRYHLWFLFLFVLVIPFLPCSLLCNGIGFRLFGGLKNSLAKESASAAAALQSVSVSGLMNDFTVSVSHKASPDFPVLFFAIWGTGMIIMAFFTFLSSLNTRRIRQASLPMQNKNIRCLYDRCKKELGIKKDIPIYSSAYLTSPIATGFTKPVIIVPIHMLLDFTEKEIRHIFLHELTHLKHNDLIINRFMALAQIVYWYHPAVWIALKEMRQEREITCDLSVLSMLEENSHLEYGKTLIRFAEKLSHPSYFAAGIGGPAKEIRKRIIHIAGYHKETRWEQIKSRLILAAAAGFILFLTPVMSVSASSSPNYSFQADHIKRLYLDSYFQGYQGCFVLYDINSCQYSIYNQKSGTTRISPDSTYKIYSALAALKTGVITPDDSLIKWDKTPYPYEAWNGDQNLSTAMNHSVNWYFKTLDERTGLSNLKDSLIRIGYGNKDLSGGLGEYWLESSLKISPVEQVELLTKFYQEDLPFTPDHIKTVKDSLYLSSSYGSSLYGKTGTGTIEGKNVNGWFIGYLESDRDTYVFATNIQNDHSASGSAAGQITLRILNDLHLYQH